MANDDTASCVSPFTNTVPIFIYLTASGTIISAHGHIHLEDNEAYHSWNRGWKWRGEGASLLRWLHRVGQVQNLKGADFAAMYLFDSSRRTLCYFFLHLHILLQKTTLARAVFKELGGEKNVVYLTHDHYYKDLSHKTLEERAKTNFDHPDSLETDLLVQHLKDLKEGKVANLPTYDFATHSRTPVTQFVHPKRIIIVEGILVLTHQALCDEMDIRVFVVSLACIIIVCLRSRILPLSNLMQIPGCRK